MHVEKNVCNSVICTLLNIKGKRKDKVKKQPNLVGMGIRPKLHRQLFERCTYLRPSCHAFCKKKKKLFSVFK